VLARLGALLFLGVALVAAPVHGAPRNSGAQRAPAEQSQPRAAPATPAASQVIQVEPSPKAVAEAAEREAQKRRFLGLEPDAWIAIFTLVLAVFTAVLAVVSFVQIGYLNKADTTAAKNAEAAMLTALATMAGQRAVVIPEPFRSTDGKGNWNFSVKWSNAGALATRNMRNHIDYAEVDGELPASFVFPDDAEPIATCTLGRGQSIFGPHIPKEGMITSRQVSQVRNGTKNIYFYGWAKYFDGFPDTPERVTKFCYRLRVTGNPQAPIVFISHDRHNCVDEGCNQEAEDAGLSQPS
jgi:hypothetical protein